jgi:hypothetical protein
MAGVAEETTFVNNRDPDVKFVPVPIAVIVAEVAPAVVVLPTFV